MLPNIFSSSDTALVKELKNVLGIKPGKILLYKIALSHRSVKDTPEENNERLEYLGDAVLSPVVADYLFKRYPAKGEGYLTEMRRKMVNRQQLNDIAVKMGLKKITRFNKFDGSLKSSQIFGNTLDAITGAIYLDKGYEKARKWVIKQILIPHMFIVKQYLSILYEFHVGLLKRRRNIPDAVSAFVISRL
jgi:ribonuclease-3